MGDCRKPCNLSFNQFYISKRTLVFGYFLSFVNQSKMFNIAISLLKLEQLLSDAITQKKVIVVITLPISLTYIYEWFC